MVRLVVIILDVRRRPADDNPLLEIPEAEITVVCVEGSSKMNQGDDSGFAGDHGTLERQS